MLPFKNDIQLYYNFININGSVIYLFNGGYCTATDVSACILYMLLTAYGLTVETCEDMIDFCFLLNYLIG